MNGSTHESSPSENAGIRLNHYLKQPDNVCEYHGFWSVRLYQLEAVMTGHESARMNTRIAAGKYGLGELVS